MEADASTLLGFPPQQPDLPDELYDEAARRHISLLEGIFAKPPAGEKAVQLLKVRERLQTGRIANCL